MEYYHKLKKLLCKELEEITDKGELSAGSLETIDKLTHSIKSLDTIMAMEDGGYSRDGYSGRRDSMGRYADGASYENRSYARYNDSSYEDGYSGRRRYSRDEGKSYMMQELESLMQKAQNQDEREVMQQALKQLKNM